MMGVSSWDSRPMSKLKDNDKIKRLATFFHDTQKSEKEASRTRTQNALETRPNELKSDEKLLSDDEKNTQSKQLIRSC